MFQVAGYAKVTGSVNLSKHGNMKGIAHRGCFKTLNKLYS